MTPEEQELRETIHGYQEEAPPHSVTVPEPEKKTVNPQTIFSWIAPLRAYKRKPAGVLRFYIAIALLLSLIVFFFGDKILILPIWATVFLVYVLTITPPPIVENKVTKFGIETIGNAYKWDQLSHFYFIKKFEYHVLTVVSIPPQNTHIYLVITKEEEKEKILHMLSEHLVFLEEPSKTLTDKMAEWLTQLMPDYEESSSKPEEAPLSPQTHAPSEVRPHLM